MSTDTTPATAGATLRITGEISARHFDDTDRAEVRVFPSFTIEWQQKIADELGVERDDVLRALVLAAPLLTAAADAPQRDALAARVAAVRSLYEKRCAETIHAFTDGEELFLADLRTVLDGAQES